MTDGPIGAREARFGPAWSASLQRGTDAELRGWLEVAIAACDEADMIARRISDATCRSPPSRIARS